MKPTSPTDRESKLPTVPALQIDNLDKSFGTNRVLHGVQLSVNIGSICGIIGNNGAGKTTLLRCISGLEQSDSGVVRIFQQSFADGGNTLKRYLGVMPEHSAIVDYLTIQEFLLFSGELYGISANILQPRIDELIIHLDLPRNSRTVVRTSSTGTRKKLGFAAAILHSPRLLLLDEPFESVEPQTVAWMKQYLQDFANNGGAVLVVSHMLDTLDRVCDHIAVLHGGVIVWDGNRMLEKNNGYALAGESFTSLESLYLKIIQHSNASTI
jgi:ABC-2 type transport system ATP-binding protein